MKKIIIAALLFAAGVFAANAAINTSVTLRVVDKTKGYITNNVSDNNETNLICWIDDKLTAWNPRTPSDWWYPLYSETGVTPNGALVKTDSSWNWTITLQVSDTGSFEWNILAKTLGWANINPNMWGYTPDKGDNLVFHVDADGKITGHPELVIDTAKPKHPVTLQVIDMTKGVLTDAPGTWAYDANIVAWVSAGNDSPHWFYGFFGRENVDWEGAGNNPVTFPRGKLIKADTAWIWQATFDLQEGSYQWNPMSIVHGWASLNNTIGDAHWDGTNMSYTVSENGAVSGSYRLILNYPNPNGIKVACIGNSNTEGAGASNRSTYAWPIQLRGELTSDYSTANMGVSGATLMNFPDPWGAWTNDVLSKFSEFKQYNANVVLIALGTNDSKDDYWNARGTQFKNEYISFLDTVKKYSASGVEVYMITPIKALANGFGINNTNITTGVIPAIRELSLEKGISVIDWYDISKDWTNSEIGDGVHAGDAALGTMAEKVADILLAEKPVVAIDDENNAVSEKNYAEYRWYKNDALVSQSTSASGKEYTANEAGTYKLAVKLSTNTDDIILSNNIVVSETPQNLIMAENTSVSTPALHKSVFSVSPNPVSDKLYIIDSRNGVTYTLLDIKGNVVLKTQYKTINVSQLPSGVYILSAGGETVKIIKK